MGIRESSGNAFDMVHACDCGLEEDDEEKNMRKDSITSPGVRDKVKLNLTLISLSASPSPFVVSFHFQFCRPTAGLI